MPDAAGPGHRMNGSAQMKFAMCNEFCQGWAIEDAFRLARDVGYSGVEVAPFTIADRVEDVPSLRREQIRATAADLGVEIIGLHWLLVKPEGLYMNHPDAELRKRTRDYMIELIRFCADLGGDRMVIGSPKQRNVLPGVPFEQAWHWACDSFRSLLDEAAARGVTLCIEPLAPSETNFITTVRDGMRMVDELNHPNFKVHIDVKAMCGEGRPLDVIIREAKGYVGHFHVNDANRNGPGWGDTDYGPIVQAVRDIGYDDYASVEVFDFSYDPKLIAQSSLDFLKTAFA